MKDLPHILYRASQVRELDRIAIEEFAIPGAVLMERAGKAAFEAIQNHWPDAGCIAVLCGAGNNGGDGYVVARLAHEAGLAVDVLQLGGVVRVRGDARTALDTLHQAGVVETPYAGQPLAGYDIIVDAMLGTGLERPVEGDWLTAIRATNHSKCRVLAIDIPTGLHADSGSVLGMAVKADITITFIGVKQGLLTAQGVEACGKLVFSSLNVPDEVFSRIAPAAVTTAAFNSQCPLPRRSRNAHKGDFGHVLVIGGDRGMSGAVRLAGEAAARVGAGLVSIATQPEHALLLNLTCPELMVHGVSGQANISPLLRRASVLAIGPGLGQSRWAQQMLATSLEAGRIMVVDADALNLLAQNPIKCDDWILTPHPGEAARLLGVTTQEVQQDRFRAVREIQRRYGGICVLKGAGTLIDAGHRATVVCVEGNPGMAGGGMGDVLTGVIAGLLAQGLSPVAAACHGVALHARAGDQAARQGERGMLASDLMPYLRQLSNA